MLICHLISILTIFPAGRLLGFYSGVLEGIARVGSHEDDDGGGDNMEVPEDTQCAKQGEGESPSRSMRNLVNAFEN